MQRPEEFDIGKYTIRRDSNAYVISRGSHEKRFTRFHSAVQALSENIDIYYFKGSYSARLLNFDALPRADVDLIPLEVDAKLSSPVSWGSAVAGSASGMLMASMMKSIWKRERTQRRRIARVIDQYPEDLRDEIEDLLDVIRPLSPSVFFADAIKEHFRSIPRMKPTNDGVEDFVADMGAKVAMQIASVEGDYMRQAGGVGTKIHGILELVARNAVEVNSVLWPATFVKTACKGLEDDLIDRAKVTWETTVDRLGFEASHIIAIEPVIIVNHHGEEIAGAADMILLLNDEVVIVDWKTSRKVTSRADYAIQVSTYSLASRILCEDGDITVSHPEILSRQQKQDTQDEITRLLVAGEIEDAVELAKELQEDESAEHESQSTATLIDGSIYPMAPYAVLVRVDSIDNPAEVYKVDISGSIREFVLRLLHTNAVVSEAKLSTRIRQIRRKKAKECPN
jgi:hypothetical protein